MAVKFIRDKRTGELEAVKNGKNLGIVSTIGDEMKEDKKKSKYNK
mgnify:CR=1 FL=1